MPEVLTIWKLGSEPRFRLGVLKWWSLIPEGHLQRDTYLSNKRKNALGRHNHLRSKPWLFSPAEHSCVTYQFWISFTKL